MDYLLMISKCTLPFSFIIALVASIHFTHMLCQNMFIKVTSISLLTIHNPYVDVLRFNMLDQRNFISRLMLAIITGVSGPFMFC